MDVGEAWRLAALRLPDGWQLDSLRCASTGLDPDKRSEEWIAVVLDPAGREHRYQAADPIAALEAVSAS